MVKDDTIPYVCVDIEIITYKDEAKIRTYLENNAERYIFDLNKTNATKLKELGIKSPKQTIGKILYFKKALARNPDTNKEVDSLRICKVE
jgi:hypothetical protein